MQKGKWSQIEVVLLEDMTEQSSWEEMECLQMLSLLSYFRGEGGRGGSR